MRMSPESGSMPIMAISSPRQAEMQPFNKAPSAREATMVKPKKPRAKYSGALKSSAKLASCGATVVKTKQENTPPIKDAQVVISRAFRDCPFSVSLGPSSMVAAAAAVPGVLTKIAVILPA